MCDEGLQSRDHGVSRGDGKPLASGLGLSLSLGDRRGLAAHGFQPLFGLIEASEGGLQRTGTRLALRHVGNGLILELLTGNEHTLAHIQLRFNLPFFGCS